jgi:hypothetical protein
MLFKMHCNIKITLNYIYYIFICLKVDFEYSNNDEINEGLVGRINFINEKCFMVRKKIKKQKHHSIKLEAPCNDICILPNNNLVSANYYDKSLILYDQEFKKIKKVGKIKEAQTFAPFSIALDNQNQQLYITDIGHHRIILMDMNLNFIKTFGSEGSADDQFNRPAGICYKNNRLYVCDVKNKRIQIFENDFKLSKSFQLDIESWLIKVNDTTICLQLEKPTGLHFYDLKTFNLQHKYDHGWCRISEINSYFYEFDNKSSKIYCYSDSGVLIYDFDTTNLIIDNLQSHWTGYIFEFGQNLFMILNKNKHLLKF